MSNSDVLDRGATGADDFAVTMNCSSYVAQCARQTAALDVGRLPPVIVKPSSLCDHCHQE